MIDCLVVQILGWHHLLNEIGRETGLYIVCLTSLKIVFEKNPHYYRL